MTDQLRLSRRSLIVTLETQGHWVTDQLLRRSLDRSLESQVTGHRLLLERSSAIALVIEAISLTSHR